MTRISATISATSAMLALALAGCGGGRVMLNLTTEDGVTVAGVEKVELVLLAPEASAKKQRRNLNTYDPADKEVVVYVAQVEDTIAVDVPGGSVDGLRIQLDDDGDDEYLPLVVARDAEGKIAGVGVYGADALFAVTAPGNSLETPSVSFASNEVRLYDVALEPAAEMAYASSANVPAGMVMRVPCNGQPAGAVWRHRRSGKQLRVTVGEDAENRLHGPDLDCDTHTPGDLLRDVGDELDCDDTSEQIHSMAQPVCGNHVDDNCDAAVDIAPSEMCQSACGGTGLCVDSTIGDKLCLYATCHTGCLVPSSPDEANANAMLACPSSLKLSLPECQAGCQVTLSEVSSGFTVKIGLGTADHGLGQPLQLAASEPAMEITVAVSSGMSWPFAGTAPQGRFTLYVEAMGSSSGHTFPLTLDDPMAACSTDALIVCTP